MKNTKHLSITIIIIMALISLTISCSDMIMELKQGIIEVNIDTTSFIEGAEFEVTATHKDSRAIIATIVTTQFPLLIKPVIIGEWDVTVKALYEGNIIGEATSLTNVEEGKKASLSIAVTKAESRLTGISFDTTPTEFSFDADTFVYDNLIVENSVSLLTITPYSSSGTRINVGGHIVYSGNASPLIPLTAGTETAINIKVYESGKTAKTYTLRITREKPKVLPITVYPGGGTYYSTQIFRLSSGTSGTTIYYTTDGTDPNPNTSSVYNSSSHITLTEDETSIKAIAIKNGFTSSDIVSESYTINKGYNIGDVGPAGGLVYYVNNSTTYLEDGWKYMEVAPGGWYKGTTHSGGAYTGVEDPLFEWGAELQPTYPQAYGERMGDGRANTDAIVSYHNNLGDYYTNPTKYNQFNDGTVAAKECDDFTMIHNGVEYDDWFLPSRWELRWMYENIRTNNLAGFSLDGIYWTSSFEEENDFNMSRILEFSNGRESFGSQSLMFQVRPVRAFL